MAKAFPKSKFFGFDYHDKSIEGARESAKREGLADRVSFEVAKAKEFPGFDCLHDMGDPVGAAKHVRQSLNEDGTWMIVEPFANDELKDNLNPVGRVSLVLDVAVHSVFAVPGGRAVPGSTGGRNAHPGSVDGGGFYPVPPGDRDSVQYCV